MALAPSPRRLFSSDAERRAARKTGTLTAFLFIVCVLCFPYSETVRNANEVPRLMQGLSLVEYGTFAIDKAVSHMGNPGPDIARAEGGGMYPNKPPGVSLLAAAAYMIAKPIYAAFDVPFTVRAYTLWTRILSGALPTVWLCAFLFSRYVPLVGRDAARLGVVLYALGTPAIVYAHLAYGHQLAASLVVIGTLVCLDGQRQEKEKVAALGGVMAGAAVAVEYGAVFYALPLGVALLTRMGRSGPQVVGAAVGGALVPVLLLAVYHWAAFGSPIATGYHNVLDPSFAAKHGQGMLGLGMPTAEGFHKHMLDPGGGLLWWAPATVVGLWGLGALALDREEVYATEARVGLGVLALYILIVSSLSFDGGWRVGPRYMVVALPWLALGLAHTAMGAASGSPRQMIIVITGTIGVTACTLAANLWPHFDLENIGSPVVDVLVPLIKGGFEPYSFTDWLIGLSGFWIVVGITAIGVWTCFLRNSRLGLANAIVLGAMTIAGVWLVFWMGESARMGAGARGNLGYIKSVWEPDHDREEPLRSREL